MAAFSRLPGFPPCSPTKLPLSVAVIGQLDAESQLGALLSSVAFADEVVVVDSAAATALPPSPSEWAPG